VQDKLKDAASSPSFFWITSGCCSTTFQRTRSADFLTMTGPILQNQPEKNGQGSPSTITLTDSKWSLPVEFTARLLLSSTI
jgi:hypothetical protein